eukprot:TRINITY_DN1055_c0_g1_i10.p1 TRINITY_DN1055_c0_g1~~TRINITY_DN1055_c0_g1_i10.p1  ORF type:complete len:660 (-),score=170.16 TRINITY_DN1055_c0_g1_i10:383-2362(-)
MSGKHGIHRYSPDCSRLASVSQDGRLLIWSKSGELEQQYSPSSHLSAMITSLAWSPQHSHNKNGKKKKNKGQTNSDMIALGTSNGSLLIYSIKQGDTVTNFDVSNHKVLSVTWSNSGKSVVCGSQHGDVTICCIMSLQVICRFKTGKEPVHAVALTNNDKKIVSASHKIQVWDVQTQSLQQTFLGHSLPVTLMQCVQCKDTAYVMSTAAEDRNISIWRLDGKQDSSLSPKKKKGDPVHATLSVNEIVRDISCLKADKNDDVLVCATTDAGKVSVFRCSLEASRQKPIKPYSNIQVICERQEKISDIPVLTAQLVQHEVPFLSLSYGSDAKLKLEDIKIAELRENHILAREMPTLALNGEQHKDFTKVVPMKNADDVKYLMAGSDTKGQPTTPKTIAKSGRGEKRRNNEPVEQSLEERLALLEPSSSDKDTASKTGSFARLLVQGLHSKNQSLLMSVLDREDLQMIESTIKCLPVEYVVPLLETLHQNIQSKGFSLSHVIWAQSLVRHHVGYLVSLPHIHTQILLPMSDLMTARTANYLPLLKLKGKIEMIKGQMERNRNQAMMDTEHQPLIVYQDDSDESDTEDQENLLPPRRVEYDSDFLDEYLSENNAGDSSESESDDEVVENGESGSEAEIMETETVLVNGHNNAPGADEDDMDED